jgi:hypothetical protein
MTAQPEPEYIITESELCKAIHGIDDALKCHHLVKRIRSRPHNTAPERTLKCNCEPKAKGGDTDPEMCKSCLPEYQRVGCSCLDMHDEYVKKQARHSAIYEILKDFKFACPGGEITPICDLCGANLYCNELRSEVKKE